MSVEVVECVICDFLIGVYNWCYFEEFDFFLLCFGLLWGVLFIDFDDFKDVNDCFGYDEGDCVF